MSSLREPVLGLVLTALAFLGGAAAASVLATPPSVFAARPAQVGALPAAAPRREAPPLRNH